MFLWADNFQGLHRLFSSLCFPMLHSDMGEGAFSFCLQTCEKTKVVPNRGETGDEGKEHSVYTFHKQLTGALL